MGRIPSHRNVSSSATATLAHDSTAPARTHSHRHTSIAIGAGVAGGVCLLILVVLVLLVYRKLKKSRRTTPASEQSPIRLRKFSYRELRAATGRFSEGQKLGQGGFGSVYRGTLKNGQQIAVKKLDTASLQGEREFMNELSICGSFPAGSDTHVVGLIGFCADSKRKMLVYEFMANRSLQEALFDEKRRLQLDWAQRVKIVLDVAKALAFLHGKCEPGIVHGDVKPSNVLLDSQFGAKLADFGLARVKSAQQTDLKSEELQRDSIERETVRSQRMARDRERKKRRRSVPAPVEVGAEDQPDHGVQVSQDSQVQDKDEEKEDVAKLSISVDNRMDQAAGDGDENDKAGEMGGKKDDNKVNGDSKILLSGTSGDEQQTDGSGSKSPVLSSPTSKPNVECKALPANGVADDDDDWSKMSQSAYGTEADTWSKISPSEVDCRSEISMDSAGPNMKPGRNFLSKKTWGRKKGTSPLSGNKEWWWKQESSEGGGGVEFSIKEYIVDWVSCENRRGRSRTREWPWNTTASGIGGSKTPTATGTDAAAKKKKKARSGSLEWWAECEDDAELARRIKAEQKRKKKLQKQQEKLAKSVTRDDSREWFRDQGGSVTSGELFSNTEDFSAEIGKNQPDMKRSMSEESFTFYHSGEIPSKSSNVAKNNNNNNATTNNPSLTNSMELLSSLGHAEENGRRRVRTRSRDWWSGEMQRGREWWSGELGSKKINTSELGHGRRIFENWSRDSLSGELNHRPRHHRHRSRSRSREWWSGDLMSRATTVSSTPSMRGTVCYVAPEYGGGGGMLTEKADVYSFGVLILVVVSGRRPLQVVASPLSEFERANLISWARHAAQAGRGLDLVDASLGANFSKEQATLFISVALLCLQRLPALRPTMSEVVKILSGEAELPALPFEFSPSPSGCSFKSRRKASSDHVAVDMPLLAS